MKTSSAVIFSRDNAHFLVQKPGKEAVNSKSDYLVWDEPETYLIGGGWLADVQAAVREARLIAKEMSQDRGVVELYPLASAVDRWVNAWRYVPSLEPRPSLETELEMTPYDFSIEPEKQQFGAELALFTKKEGWFVWKNAMYGFRVGIALGTLGHWNDEIIHGLGGRPDYAEDALERLERILKSWQSLHTDGDIWTL